MSNKAYLWMFVYPFAESPLDLILQGDVLFHFRQVHFVFSNWPLDGTQTIWSK